MEKTKQVVQVSRMSLDVIRSRNLDDSEKEAALQRDAKKLFGLFFVLSLGGAAAVALPLGLLWLGDLIGFIALDQVLDILISPVFLIISGALITALLVLSFIRPRGKSSYPALDRLFHRIAFSTRMAQIPVSDIEDRIYSKQLALCKADRPVFITALPRAGTTLLLECLAGMPEFASHCYRDMPFVLTPCLWSRFSIAFRQTSELRERAHGDGMLINVDSPEALEEVLWKTFWRRHYHSDRITPWHIEEHDEFEEFFRNHMRKIMLLRRGEGAPEARYVSKNNLNISRIPTLRHFFPSSVIIVLFRQPLHHADSLLKQHRNFLQIHKEDPFASKYMRAIGHFDFGRNLRPIDFDGWLDKRVSKEADNLAFWMEYWVASYQYLLTANVEGVHFLSYESLCENPQQTLSVLSEVAGVRDTKALLESESRIYPPMEREVDTSDIPMPLQQEANDLYARLKQDALT